MQSVLLLQTLLHELEESSQYSKVQEKPKRTRRKTVTGVPEIDKDTEFEELLTPRSVQENLKTVKKLKS